MKSLDDFRGEERLDSRELIDAREEAQTLLDDAPTEEERDDALALIEAVNELESESGPDWQYGEQYVREDMFEDYARELAEDIGAPGRVEHIWPTSCIDWERAARELAMDYSLVAFAGHNYYVRL